MAYCVVSVWGLITGRTVNDRLMCADKSTISHYNFFFYLLHNLPSPHNIGQPIQDLDIQTWFKKEINDVEPECLKEIFLSIYHDYDELCQFSQTALLLIEGCDRRPEEGKKMKYHRYPEYIKQVAKEKGIGLDSRPNGPAIAAFELAGGMRPQRYGSNNKWHIHHLYSGKFPYFGKSETVHAAKNGLHFTQSAGLIAVHPVLDALCDESPAFTWFLRHLSWKKFGYDPDNVFSSQNDRYGFDLQHKTNNKILCSL